MTELLTDPEVLKRMEPNRELLKMVLELKSMMTVSYTHLIFLLNG